jgi:nickel-dependent lactate racemase
MDPIILPYGDSTIEVPLPGGASPETAGHAFPEPLPDISLSVDRALDEPAGCGPFSDMIPASGRVAVLVSDLTRGRTAAAILVPVLKYLERHGAGPDRTTIYIAGGMHRGRAAAEIEAQLGAVVAGRYGIVQHDARDASSLVEAGTTSSGTRCFFNREVTESALVVGAGALSFHYFAGFGGGRKLILPGISGEETIMTNHRRSLRDDPSEGLSDGCAPGVLDGNPVHEDMIEGASLLPAPVFMINAVAGSGGKPAFVCAGDIDVSHRIAAERLREEYAIFPGSRRRVVIASAGGSHRDINLLQAHKAIRHASLAVEDGGLLLMAAECGEGIGSGSLEEDFSGGRDGVPSRVSGRYTLNSQASISICEITGRIEVRLLSGLPADILEKFGFGSWKVGETVSLLEGIPEGDLLAIPHAVSFLPVIK